MCSASESKIFPSIIVTRPGEKKTFPPLEMGISKKKRKSTSQEIVVILGCLLREKSFPKSPGLRTTPGKRSELRFHMYLWSEKPGSSPREMS